MVSASTGRRNGWRTSRAGGTSFVCFFLVRRNRMAPPRRVNRRVNLARDRALGTDFACQKPHPRKSREKWGPREKPSHVKGCATRLSNVAFLTGRHPTGSCAATGSASAFHSWLLQLFAEFEGVFFRKVKKERRSPGFECLGRSKRRFRTIFDFSSAPRLVSISLRGHLGAAGQVRALAT